MGNDMTYGQLGELLERTCLFTQEEIDNILRATGVASIGNAVTACLITLGMKLTGNDIDTIIHTAYEED